MSKISLRNPLKSVLDNFRTQNTAPARVELPEFEDALRSEHFQSAKTIRHGFPYYPTALAFDPLQNLLAIGTRSGSIRIFGTPGVDCHIKHDDNVSVLQLIFIVNEGALISVCSDDTLYLWTLRQKKPEIIHSLKFQRERITVCHLPFKSQYLYIGTEKGNVHVAQTLHFTLSGYLINWNKAIDLSQRNHPGAVIHLSDNPLDQNQMLIGFECGNMVLWDLKNKIAERRYSYNETLRSISWHSEGKQFMSSHLDGSLAVWNVKVPKPVNILYPHAKIGADGKPEPCGAIMKVEWKTVRNDEPYQIFSGGMEKSIRTPSLTVVHGKSTTVLEMEHKVIDFVTLCRTPWVTEFQDPYGIVVLLQNDLVVIDLSTPGYPCFENPYPMDIHESAVTCCQYYANCSDDLIPAFYTVGSKQKRTCFSDKEWPIKGGNWGTTPCSYSEIIITGHADGSLKFWDASSVTLQQLYKLKTVKVFDRSKCRGPESEEDPFAIQHIHLCEESRLLIVAGHTHLLLMKFSKSEASIDLVTLDISITYEIYDELDSPDLEYPSTPLKPSLTNQQSGSMGSYSSTASAADNKNEVCGSVKAKSGARKWSAGYQPELCCVLSWIDGEPPPVITAVTVNHKYNLLAFGNECGLAIVDIAQKTCILNMGTPDLYGSMDPYSRAPRSPKPRVTHQRTLGDGMSQPYVPDDNKNSSNTDQVDLDVSPSLSGRFPRLTASQSLLTSIREQSSIDSPDQSPPTSSTPKRSPRSIIKRNKSEKHITTSAAISDEPRKRHSSHESLFQRRSSKENKTAHPKVNIEFANKQQKQQQQTQQTSSSGSGSGSGGSSGGGGGLVTGRSEGVSTRKLSPRRENPAATIVMEQNTVKFTTGANDSTSDINKDDGSAVEENASGADTANIEDLDIDSIFAKCNPSVSTEELNMDAEQKHQHPVHHAPLTSTKSLPAKVLVSSTESVTHESKPPRHSFCDPPELTEKELEVLRDLQTCELSGSDAESESYMSSSLRGLSESSDTLDNRKEPSPSNSGSSHKVEGHHHRKKSNFLKTFRKKHYSDSGELERSSETSHNESISEGDFSKADAVDNNNSKHSARLEPQSAPVLMANQEKGIVNKLGVLFRASVIASRVSGGDKEGGGEGGGTTGSTTASCSGKDGKFNIIDLTSDDPHDLKMIVKKMTYKAHAQMDKADGSFSRSRSSSMSSLENVSKEAVQSLVFADAYISKTDAISSPSLWVGTTLGSVLVISLSIPTDVEQRKSQPVLATPNGTIFRLKGIIVTIGFMECSPTFNPSTQSSDYRERARDEWIKDRRYNRQQSVTNMKARMSPTSSTDNNDRQLAIICSERHARVVALPSQTYASKVKITDTSVVVNAEVIPMKDGLCLGCYVANGHILMFGLPSLKPLLDVDHMPVTDVRVAKTFSFSRNGHALYFCSPTELQKITLSADICENLSEMLGELFLTRETPEPPKTSFLDNLFGGGQKVLDREELFGESSGKASIGVAKYTAGTGGMDKVHEGAGGAMGEVARAKMALIERGAALSSVEDQSARMREAAEAYSKNTHDLMNKYKDKKWYQL